MFVSVVQSTILFKATEIYIFLSNKQVNEFSAMIEFTFIASTETTTEFENSTIMVGLSDGPTITEDVIKLDQRRPNNISTQEQIPTTMEFEVFAAVYCNTL